MSTKFVCIAGPQEAGKNFLSNTIAESIREKYGLRTTVDAIARPIYNIACALTGDEDFSWNDTIAQRRAKAKAYTLIDRPKASITNRNDIESINRGEMHVRIDFEPMIVTGRELLQDIGRAFRVLYDREDFWIEQLVARNNDKYDVVIVCDCRMPSEAAVSPCLVWIETMQQVAQQRPEDESEKHLSFLRKNANIQVVRDGNSYWSGENNCALTVDGDLTRSICRAIGINQDWKTNT